MATVAAAVSGGGPASSASSRSAAMWWSSCGSVTVSWSSWLLLMGHLVGSGRGLDSMSRPGAGRRGDDRSDPLAERGPGAVNADADVVDAGSQVLGHFAVAPSLEAVQAERVGLFRRQVGQGGAEAGGQFRLLRAVRRARAATGVEKGVHGVAARGLLARRP